MKQLTYSKATNSQIKTARSFAEEHPTMSLSQCVKWLEYIFAFKRGEMSAEAFKAATGHDATFKQFQPR